MELFRTMKEGHTMDFEGEVWVIEKIRDAGMRRFLVIYPEDTPLAARVTVELFEAMPAIRPSQSKSHKLVAQIP